MLTPRWRKIRGDLSAARGRFAIMLAALVASVCALAAILAAYSVLIREVSRNYLSTNPASAQLELNGVDGQLVRTVQGQPGVTDAEASSVVVGRIAVANNEWLPLRLFVIPDFGTLHINAFHRQSGAWPPTTGSMLVERSALALTRRNVGQTVTVETPGGSRRSLLIEGLVHDPGLAPAWQEQTVYGYITPATLAVLGEKPNLHLLKIVVDKGTDDVRAIEKTSVGLAGWLAQNGTAVSEIRVPPPHTHPHQRQMSAVLFMLSSFSAMALLLGAVLAAVMVSALLAQQVRQIAIMKAIGARPRQIAFLYLTLVAAVGGTAVVLGLPLGLFAGREFARRVAEMLNLDIATYSVPWWSLALTVALGLLAPLVAATVPIAGASRKTIRASIDDHGLGTTAVGTGLGDRLLRRIHNPDVSLTIAVRNTFRRRARLIFTLALLGTAGAMFITSLDLKAAWQEEIAEARSGRHYESEIDFQKPELERQVLEIVRGTPGVERVEPWNTTPASVDRGDHLDISHTYPDGGHGGFTLRSAVLSSDFVSHTHVDGRWLNAQDTDAVVLNSLARASLFPHVRPGDVVSLLIDGHPIRVTVVGLLRQPMTSATAYTTPMLFARATGRHALTNAVRVRVSAEASIDQVSRSMVQALEHEQLAVKLVLTESVLAKAQGGHISILVFALLFLAALMAIVGLMGLLSALGTGVAERTREFGVMRAIGARTGQIQKIVVGEALSVGLLSGALAVPLALLLSMQVGNVVASISFEPLSLQLSWPSVGLWLALALIGAIAASVSPAMRAARLTIQQTLKHV